MCTRLHESSHNAPLYGTSSFTTVAPRLYAMAGVGPEDVDVLQSYENFTGGVLMSLVEHGFFPPEAYFDLGSMSKRYLLYSEESLEHRFIVVPEWASVANDEELVASLRLLLSEGRLIHGTVEGDGGTYVDYLWTRLEPPRAFVATAEDARVR